MILILTIFMAVILALGWLHLLNDAYTKLDEIHKAVVGKKEDK